MEEWCSIKDFENYQISNYGRIKNTIRNKILSPGNNGRGYLYINLSKNGIKTRKYMHRLVAEYFIPNPYGYPQVNHKDENKANNRADNLEWCTQSYNTNYGTANYRRKVNQPARPEGNKILCVETGVIYPSIREAGRQTNLFYNNIIIALDKPNRTCGGYHWKNVKVIIED